MDKDSMLREWDLSGIPTPAYVVHRSMLMENLRLIDEVRKGAGVEVIVALKANATWHLFATLKEHSDGATASSLSEAKLVEEKMGEGTHLRTRICRGGD